jgi:hypothetical protein
VSPTDPTLGAHAALDSSALRVWIAVVAAFYAAFSLAGLTGSSLATLRISERGVGDAPGVLMGVPREIRSDEYLRATPWELGLLARGDDGFASPLAYPDVALAAPTARDVPSALLHWEAVALTAGRWLPDEVVFAAVWWFPVVLVAVLLPLWLVRLGAVPAVGVAATALIVFSPASEWWSWGPLAVLAPALLAAVLVLWGVDRWARVGRNVRSFAALAVAALCVAKTTTGYAPWAIPLTAVVFAPTLAVLLRPGARRLGLTCALGTFAAGVVLAVLLVAPSGAAEVIADTVYPGGRRNIGAFVGLDLLFGAPHLWILQASPRISETNASELSTGYAVLALPAVLIALAVRRRSAATWPAAAVGAVLAVAATWVLVDWPRSVAARAFPLTLVQPERMTQVLGIGVTIAFALLLSIWATGSKPHRMPVAVTAGAGTALFTALGGFDLSDGALPTLPGAAVVVVSVLVGLAVLVALLRPTSTLALAALPSFAFLVVATANPVQHGFGDLRGSEAASAVRTATEQLAEGEYWAADDPALDALLMSNGAPALSGQQWVGPQEDAWRVLDPAERSRGAWNRGATFIAFSWAPGAKVSIRASQRDVVLVTADPCDPALRRLGLRLVVSTRPLRADCLVRRLDFHWGIADRLVYSVS